MTSAMAQRLDTKQEWSRKEQQRQREAIHSGHFMVSSFEAEAQDDEDEVAVPVPEEVEVEVQKSVVIPRSSLNCRPVASVSASTSAHVHSLKVPWQHLSIETSLTKLFQCMSLAYRQKLTSPKWNRFKGIRLRWKDKIRLNNVIWRCWHMQFIKKKNTLVCQFASPLDVDTHNKPEAVVLEGKYWKRKLNAVTAEYKKWRLFSHNQLLGRPNKDSLDMLAELEGQEWQMTPTDSLMMVDEDYMGLMSDTLFSTISANQPFAFPDTREIARGANLADFIQPSLVQLQPNLDEFMDFEPLHDFLYTKLTPVPEEQTAAGLPPPSPSPQVQPYGGMKPADQYSYHQGVWYVPQTPYENQVAQTSPYVPPPPPPPPVQQVNLTDISLPRKPEVFALPKPNRGSHSRTRPDGMKKKVAPGPAQIIQSEVGPRLADQNHALLAQLLTNNARSSYSYIAPEPSSSPTKLPLTGAEDVTYLQQTYGSIENQFLFQPDSEFSVKSEGNSNSSTGSHPSSVSPPITAAMMIKSLQTPIAGTSSGCPESPGTPDPLSLSPLNVGSPTSPTVPKPAHKQEHRRVCHINAEQKRRCNIKNGFDTLHSLIPQLNQNPNAKMSKAAMLQKGAEYIRQLQNERNQLKQEMDSLKQQIETLNSDICNCQSMLPATGAPISKHRSNKMKDWYKKYVRVRTQENWKFWILSLICEPLLETFNSSVSTVSLDQLYHTTLQWVDQHCSLTDLRPVVLNALRQLCTTTEVLSDPARLPVEARAAVEKSIEKKKS